jgi:hypothetical protein
MEDLSKYTLIELNKMINDTKEKHDKLKQEIINHSYEIENLERIINDKIEILDKIEKNYIALIEEITNR